MSGQHEPTDLPDRPIPAQDETDPTGVRDLLSSLPGPGPMPQELADRIEASLRAEALRRDQGDTGVHPLFTERRRPGRSTWLIGAAAAVAVVGVGGVALVTETPAGDALARLAGRQSASSTPGTSDAAISSAGTPQATPSVEKGTPTFRMTGTTYTAASLRARAKELLEATSPTLSTPAAEAPWIGPIATPLGLASCLQALGLPGDARVDVDLATYDDHPAVVLVTRSGPEAQVRVVRRECSTGDPALVAGPYSVS